MTSWIFIINNAVTTLSFVLPIALFALPFPDRDNAFLRRSIAVLAVLMVAVTGYSSGVLANTNQAHPLVSDALMFAGIIMFAAALVLLCKQVTTWTALYCATAGYVAQNLGSSVAWLIMSLLNGNALLSGPIEMVSCFALGTVVSCIVCYVLFVRRTLHKELGNVENRRVFALFLIVIVVNIVATMAIKELGTIDAPSELQIALTSAHIVTCALTLYLEFELLVNRRLITEVVTAQQVLKEREHQYETSRETIEAVNVRMHDMRHEVFRLITEDAGSESISRSALASVAHEMSIYDANVRTGNEALDTVLTKKNLVCARESIALTCVADGLCLSGMAVADVYAFFEALLDQAILDERTYEDKTQRTISVTVKPAGGMTSIHIEWRRALPTEQSSYEPPEEASIIVKEYDGMLTHGSQGDVCYVNALLPLA